MRMSGFAPANEKQPLPHSAGVQAAHPRDYTQSSKDSDMIIIYTESPACTVHTQHCRLVLCVICEQQTVSHLELSNDNVTAQYLTQVGVKMTQKENITANSWAH